MKTDYLQEFLTVAKHGKLGAAAREMFMSTSTLSSHIIALETELGGPLFERVGSGLVLTEGGEACLESAQRILSEYNVMRRRLTMHNGSFFSIEMPDYVFGLAPLLAVRDAFQAGHPGQRVTLKTNGLVMSDPFDLLADGLSDVVSLSTVEDSGQDPRAIVPRRYDFVTVGKTDVVFLTTPAHPLAGKPVFEVSDFDGQALLTSMCPISDIVAEGVQSRLEQLGAAVDIMYRKLNRHDDILTSNTDGYLILRGTHMDNKKYPDLILHTTDFPLKLMVHLVWDPSRLNPSQAAFMAELARAARRGDKLL